jgi:hypothetical protein
MIKMQSLQRPRNYWLLALTFCGVFLASSYWGVVASQRSNAASSSETEAADSFQRKIDHIQENSKRETPDDAPIVITQNEVNAYFAQRRLKMPDGVKSVVFQFHPGKVVALTHVDFEEITKERHSWNPLLALFSGVHDAEVVAHAKGNSGRAQVYVDSVTLDGVNVPRVALELFIEKFVNGKYPNVRLDGQYKLPAKLDTVTIGEGQSTVTQR